MARQVEPLIAKYEFDLWIHKVWRENRDIPMTFISILYMCPIRIS